VARTDHVGNVELIDVSGVGAGHGIGTADPWFFSGEPAPDNQLVADAATIAAAKACTEADSLVGGGGCITAKADAVRAEARLKGYVWRAAHPTAAGQNALAAVVERRLTATAGGTG
jgi:glycerate kinase